MTNRLRILLCCVTVAAAYAPSASAQTATGGASAPGKTALERVTCGSADEWTCGRGQRLVLQGAGMDGVEAVTFLGGEGAKDDRRSSPVRSTAAQLTVFVPDNARTGRLRLHTYGDERLVSERALTVVASASKANPDDASPADDGTFPIDGPHDMGQTATNGFGGGRNHQGQDMFARCGTPLVAVRDARVQHVATHSAAGNYVVLQDSMGRSYAYMHMRDPSLLKRGDRVLEGERVGFVGTTGRSSGCHLHFELWTAPGWYEGGRAIDPLPQLRRWERDPQHKHRR